jgi:hypothetical protein
MERGVKDDFILCELKTVYTLLNITTTNIFDTGLLEQKLNPYLKTAVS